jgi:hypothetical protein
MMVNIDSAGCATGASLRRYQSSSCCRADSQSQPTGQKISTRELLLKRTMSFHFFLLNHFAPNAAGSRILLL